MIHARRAIGPLAARFRHAGRGSSAFSPPQPWLVGARLALAILVGIITSAATGPAPTHAASAASCETSRPSLEAAAAWTALTSGTPEGAQVAMLAAGDAEYLPASVGTIQLSRLILPAGYQTASLRATGPILLYVESGAIDVFINGVRQHVLAGESALVNEFNEYGVEQVGNDAAVVLRLGVMPDNAGVQEIAIFQHLADDGASQPTVEMQVEYLVLGQGLDLPQAPATLVLACLDVSAASSLQDEVVHQGAVGFYVQHGPLRVYDSGELPTNGCTIVAPGAAHALRATNGASALVFAILPAGAPLWAEGITPRGDDEWQARYQLDCGAIGRSA